MTSENKCCCDFMDSVFAGTASARIPFGFLRAIDKASEVSGIPKQQIIFCCMTSDYNLNKVIDSFDANDLKWIHDMQAKAIEQRETKRAAMDAAEAHEKIDLEFSAKLSRK